MVPKTRAIADRFWKKVLKTDGCWIWMPAKTTGRYGSFYINRAEQSTAAHRAAYELSFGPIPAGLFVLHRCDNKSCVRPDHLFAGTHMDNVRDMMSKNRHTRGESHGMHRLNEAIVSEARRLFRSGMSPTRISSQLRVNHSTLQKVFYGRTWRHVS